MAKYGPASAWGPLIDGYNMISAKPTGVSDKKMSEMTETTGLGDSWKERVPIGIKDTELTQEGAFFDTSADNSHAALSTSVPGSPQATARIVCFGYAGSTIGEMFVGAEGAYSHEYEVLAAQDELQKANVTYSISGQRDDGLILQPLAAQTADWNTELTSVDNAASSANGGVGYIQVTSSATFTNFVGKIQHSTDDAAWADLITFTDNVSAPFAERITVAGTVNRYLSFDGNVTGSGTITVFCGFSRNE